MDWIHRATEDDFGRESGPAVREEVMFARDESLVTRSRVTRHAQASIHATNIPDGHKQTDSIKTPQTFAPQMNPTQPKKPTNLTRPDMSKTE